jgi:hypothetical protein
LRQSKDVPATRPLTGQLARQELALTQCAINLLLDLLLFLWRKLLVAVDVFVEVMLVILVFLFDINYLRITILLLSSGNLK